MREHWQYQPGDARANLFALAIVAISMVPAVVIALAAPEDVLTRSAVLRGYVAFCQILIPGIPRLAGVSAFPEVTKLVLSVVWTLAPVQILLFAWRLRLRPNWSAISRHPIASTFILLIAGFAVVSLAVLYDMRPSDLEGWTKSERLLRAVSTSRLWLGLGTGFMVSGAAIMLYAILFALRHFRRIYFREASD